MNVPRRGPRALQRKLPRGQLYVPRASSVARALARSLAPPVRGPAVDALEARFARVLESSHAVLLPHARIALLAILRALDLPPGSEVLMTPVTIPDVVNAVLIAGLTPRFVDLAPRTANVDVVQLAECVTPRTRAVLVTPLCGLAPPMDAIVSLAGKHGLVLLEDVSQAMGTRWRGRTIGTFGRAGFYSLSTLKPVASFHGGLVVTDDGDLARSLGAYARTLAPPSRRWLAKMFARDALLHAASHPLPFSLAGFRATAALERFAPHVVDEFQRGNVVYDAHRRALRVHRKTAFAPSLQTLYTDAQAALADGCLDDLAAGNTRRTQLATHLHHRLVDARVRGLVEIDRDVSPTFWRYPFFTDRPDALRAFLRARGIDAARTNLVCASREPAFAEFAAHTPEAIAFVDAMVFLPLHPNFDTADMGHIADAVIAFVRDQ